MIHFVNYLLATEKSPMQSSSQTGCPVDRRVLVSSRLPMRQMLKKPQPKCMTKISRVARSSSMSLVPVKNVLVAVFKAAGINAENTIC